MKFIRFAMPAIALFAIASHAAAADTYRYTLQIDGVSPNPFTINSVQFGVGVGIGYDPGSGIHMSDPSISEITVTKLFDSNDAGVLGGIAQGTVFTNARIRGYKNMSTTPFLDMALEEVAVSGHSMSASTNSPVSTAMSIFFRKVTINGVALDRDTSSLTSSQFNSKVSVLLAKAYADADKRKTAPARKVTIH